MDSAGGFPEETSGNGDFETRFLEVQSELEDRTLASSVLPPAFRSIFTPRQAEGKDQSKVLMQRELTVGLTGELRSGNDLSSPVHQPRNKF